MVEPLATDGKLCQKNPAGHCLHPIYERMAVPTEQPQYSVTETICCHCGRTATLTTGCGVYFHGGYAPDDPFRRVS
jgi:hypothetical protein